MTKTTNIGLNLFDQSDNKMPFSDWRNKVVGPGSDSNMQIIDGAFGAVDDKITSVANDIQIITGGIEDWSTFRKLVDAGTIGRYAPVGSQIVDTWQRNSGGMTYDAPWDIVHCIDDDDITSVYLEQHYAIPDYVPFDEPEAIYYAPAAGLAAGTYHITIGVNYGTGWRSGQSIQIILNNNMNSGDQLVINCGNSNAINPTNGRAWQVYAKGDITEKDSGTTSLGTAGTSLGTIGSTNAYVTDGQLNAIARVVYGCERWSQSAIRQYLNSEANAGAWWTPQNNWDRPSTVARTLRGWLAGCTAEFLNILQPVPVVTALNQFDGSAGTETTTDRVFLRSLNESYIDPQSADEGVVWDYYQSLAQEAGTEGRFVRGNVNAPLIGYRLNDHASAVNMYFRSCDRDVGGYVWYVNPSGLVTTYSSYTACGCRPACSISHEKS